jgi:anti-sigma-K factor RskA
MSGFEDAYDDDALVAEYVLHLLDDADRQAFEARLVADRDLRTLVNEWEARLVPLTDELAEIRPPASVRKRLLSAIEEESASHRVSMLWSWLLGGVVAAGVLAFVLFGDAFRPDLSPAFQAELASDDRSLVIVAGVIPATHEIVIDRIAGGPPEGRIHELWLIAEGADAPISLGLLESEGTTRIRVPDEIAPGVRTGTIAVSEEPLGGSPTGAPTGPVVATAQFSDV